MSKSMKRKVVDEKIVKASKVSKVSSISNISSDLNNDDKKVKSNKLKLKESKKEKDSISSVTKVKIEKKKMNFKTKPTTEEIDEIIKAGIEEFGEIEDLPDLPDNENDESALLTTEEFDEKLKLHLSVSKNKKSNKELPPKNLRGTIYVGHLPYGFYENALRKYFSQFGDISRLRVSRNPETGRTRHYAFIEFCDAKVVPIVIDAVNGYMMFGKTLKVVAVPSDKVHKSMFVQKVAAVDSYAPSTKVIAHVEWTEERLESDRVKLLERQNAWQAKGIDYTFIKA